MKVNNNEIKISKKRIDPYIVETPLLRLRNLDEYLGCQVFAKVESIQNTGSFKIRGVMNKILTLSNQELSNGVVTASSGNHGRALAYAAKNLGIKATVVIPNTAPKMKIDAIKSLGAEVILSETKERFIVAEKIASEKNATMVHPFDDEQIISGQGTIGIEIAKQEPNLDKIIVPVSGGGLISGISVAVKSSIENVKVYGAEPLVRTRYSASLEAGKPTSVDVIPTIADALASIIPGEVCFPYVQKYTDGILKVDESHILKGMKLLLMEGKILAEPSSCIGIGAVLQNEIRFNKDEKVCFIISGGNVGFDQLKYLEGVNI